MAVIKPVEFGVIAGITVATWTAEPLLIESVVMIEVKLPAIAGRVESVTISEVDVADVTVPTALLLKVTTLSVAVVSNPKPAIVMVVAFAARSAVLLVTTGMILATWVAAPLATLFVVMMAVSGPAEVGLVPKVTVSDVADAVVTVPVAPLLKTTVLLAAVPSKPTPAMTTVAAFAAKSAVAAVTTGLTLAICTAEPLFKLPIVTMAVKLPAAVGGVSKVTVKLVADAVVTVPAAPLSNVTALLAAVASKPKPLITKVVASASIFAVLAVTTGVTFATWTAAPLLTLLLVTTAVKLPAVVGLVVNVTVNEVEVAAVTVPAAPLLNVTVLLEAVGLKAVPAIVIVEALAARPVVLLVTTGRTDAICTAVPLLTLLVVTTAVRLPATVGFVPKVTVNWVVVAAVTVPTAPLLITTVLLAAVPSNPKPSIVTVATFAAMAVELLVITGETVAT